MKFIRKINFHIAVGLTRRAVSKIPYLREFQFSLLLRSTHLLCSWETTVLWVERTPEISLQYTPQAALLKKNSIKLSSSSNYTNVFVTCCNSTRILSWTRPQSRHSWSKWAMLCGLPVWSIQTCLFSTDSRWTLNLI